MDIQTLIQGNIINLLGLQALPEKEKTELLTQMGEVVQERLTDRIFLTLSGQDRAAFEKLVDSDATPEAVDTFLRSKIENFEDLVMEEVLLLKAQMVDDAAVIRKIAAQA